MVNVETYVGTASPYNFNGLVRHYYLRRGPNVADIQVNLLPKERAQSAEPRDRQAGPRAGFSPSPNATARASKWPKCRPVRRCSKRWWRKCTARIWTERIALARQIRDLFQQTNGVVDVDWYVEDDQPKYNLRVDEEKAALNGISEDDIARAMQVASAGYPAGLLHQDSEKEDVPLTVRLDRATRSDIEPHPEPEDRRVETAARWRSANWSASRR